MIFINHQQSAKAAKDYYTQHIAPGDGRYYAEENATQLKGIWHGRGSEMLGLSGEVKQGDFFRLCDNLTPDGRQLTPRNDRDRRVLSDFTFDVPKSVSLRELLLSVRETRSARSINLRRGFDQA